MIVVKRSSWRYCSRPALTWNVHKDWMIRCAFDVQVRRAAASLWRGRHVRAGRWALAWRADADPRDAGGYPAHIDDILRQDWRGELEKEIAVQHHAPALGNVQRLDRVIAERNLGAFAYPPKKVH